MAFHITIDKAGEHCDICTVLDKERLMLRLSQISRRPYPLRNFIWMHLDCFERKFAKAKKVLAKETSDAAL